MGNEPAVSVETRQDEMTTNNPRAIQGRRKAMPTLVRLLSTLLALQIVTCVQAQEDTWTFRITFAGVVDLVSNGSDTPDEVWLLLPDLGTPDSLRLPAMVRDDINPHQSRLYFSRQDGIYLGDGSLDDHAPCHRPSDQLSYLDLDNPEPVQIEISTFTELPLKLDRLSLPDGGVPCIPGTQACDAHRPIWEQIRSTNWVANIDQILEETLGEVLPLRSGLLSRPFYSGSLLDARVWLDAGAGESTSLWRKQASMNFQEVQFQSNAASTEAKAITRTLSVSYKLQDTGTVRLALLPLDGLGAHGYVVFDNSASSFVEVFIVNEPVGCEGGTKDFLGHLVLREDSENLEDWPLLKALSPPPPGSDPQCSPAENGG